jgi:8-amino-7-oxononanoate synthase
MALFDDIESGLAALHGRDQLRTRRSVLGACAPNVAVQGADGSARGMLAFNSNDYLGLAAHPAISAALVEGVARYGAGSGGSHLIGGHGTPHAQLEERLAAFVAPHLSGDDTRALTLCTGYMANLAVLGALAGSGPKGEGVAFFSEELNHASLIDGIRLAKAQTGASLSVYPHNSVDGLAAQLAACTARTKIIVTDSVFSMDGDVAPLPALLALAEAHGAWLVVDDAHGFGVLGAGGRGALEQFGLRSPNLLLMGTLGKAAGVAGAFIAGHRTPIEWMLQRARPYIFTTAAPPALSCALLASLDIIAGPEGAQRRAHLRALIERFADTLVLKHFYRLPSTTAVQPVILGGNTAAMAAAAALDEQGFWITAIRPPTVAAGTARLRITLSAAHTLAEVDRLVAAVQALDVAAAELEA